jgi:hypothetical protein
MYVHIITMCIHFWGRAVYVHKLIFVTKHSLSSTHIDTLNTYLLHTSKTSTYTQVLQNTYINLKKRKTQYIYVCLTIYVYNYIKIMFKNHHMHLYLYHNPRINFILSDKIMYFVKYTRYST